MINYPKSAIVNNKKYKINTDYRIALKCDEISRSNISDEERALAIIYLLFGDNGLNNDEDWNDLIEIGLKYLRCGKEEKMAQNKEEPNMDFEQDWSYIRSSFFYDYAVDLEKSDMHWWQFFELLCGLSEKCVLNRVRFVRDFDISKIKDKKEQQRWIEQKNQVKLEKEKTLEQKRLDALFEQQLKKGE